MTSFETRFDKKRKSSDAISLIESLKVVISETTDLLLIEDITARIDEIAIVLEDRKWELDGSCCVKFLGVIKYLSFIYKFFLLKYFSLF